MALITSSYLKSLAFNRRSFVNETTRNFSSTKVKDTKVFDVFLSHSYLDKEEVHGIYIMLTDMGYDVYVDWIVDSHLDRNQVTKDSAELIRKRLKYSKSLLLAISENASMSKWMPWELGYVDGNTSRCAILPIDQEEEDYDKKTFYRSEYLLLYPYIKQAELPDRFERMFVTESSNRYVAFDNWLKYEENPNYNTVNIDEL